MPRYRKPYTLYKRGKYYYYRTYNAKGIRTAGKTTGQTSKGAAQRYCDNLYLLNKLYTNDITFFEYAAHFYDDDSLYLTDRLEPLAKHSVNTLRSNMKYYIMPYFKDYKLEAITYSVLKDFRKSLIEKPLKVGSIVGCMSALKHVLEAAYRDDIIKDNPFNKLEPLQIKYQERDAFTLDEVIDLYKKIGEEFRPVTLLMALTGLRISEAIGLTKNDIKEGNGFLYIALTKQKLKKEYKPLKNKKNRDIPIIPEILDLIGFDDTRLSAYYRVFNAIKNDYKDAAERLLCFHSLRHFFITNTKSTGIVESKVEYVAGHTLKGISKVYTNYKVEDLLELLEWQKKIYYIITNAE